MRFILSAAAVFVLGLGVLTACQSSASPTGTETVKTDTNPVPKMEEHTHVDDAPRITLGDAKKAFDKGEAVFIDTRSKESYHNERIKGAINITKDTLEEKYKQLPRDKKIIVYCSWPDEHSSAGLVTKLKEKGFKNAYALLGGTAAWKNADYPMDTAGDKK